MLYQFLHILTNHIIMIIGIQSFENSIEESDLVAKIEIQEVIEEISEPSPKTIIKANVIEIFKNGEQYILMSKEADGYENTYWILGEETNFYQIVEADLIISSKFKRNELDDISIKDTNSGNKEGIQFFNRADFENKLKKSVNE